MVEKPDILADCLTRLRIAQCTDDAFLTRPQWPAFEYRDLGMSEATDGRVGAFHMRAKGTCQGEQGWHYHDVDFHMVFILKGSVTYRWQGVDEPIVALTGACLFQPPAEAHNVIDYSPDLEVLEITMPADYATKQLAENQDV